jgi:hypothetical protein
LSFINTHGNLVSGHAIVVIGYGSEEINGEIVEFWRVQNFHEVRGGNNGYDHISMNIMTPDGKPLINGDIMPKDLIRWSPLGPVTKSEGRISIKPVITISAAICG